ncbi:MAG TPA: outer membrane lipid asymmetry maintenance protein MlaD [Steroidobacteraceae bacterium]|jgi:phospholipid/cholesterol/gamma-HCH transport system substrate-binding protein
MRANRTLEIGTGFFVLLGFAALFFLTTQLPSNGLKVGGAQGGFRVTAQFDNIGDLKSGAPVALAGVTIGEVTGIGIDPQNYRAVVTMRIDPRYNKIPDDSDASINTQGLLGGQYVAIGAGGSETYLKNGSQIEFTQPAFVLENLVNKLFASFASKPAESGQGGSNSSASPSPGGPGTNPPAGGQPDGAKPHGGGRPK